MKLKLRKKNRRQNFATLPNCWNCQQPIKKDTDHINKENGKYLCKWSRPFVTMADVLDKFGHDLGVKPQETY